MSDNQLADIEAIVKAIHPLLGGHAPEVQGAVLGDLVATFIAGHVVLLDDEGVKEGIAAQVLELHVGLVRQLLPHNEAALRADIERKLGRSA